MNAHLFIIHFPVALIVLGAAAELAGVGLGDRALRVRAGQLLIIGGIAAFLAFVTGEGAKLAAINSGELDLLRLTAHEQWASVGAWALLGAAVARAMWRHTFEGAMGWVNLAIAMTAAALVVAITLSGTVVRHGI